MQQLFKHTLPTQDIVVRQDAESNSDVLESVTGQVYPLIRIKEQTVEFTNIVSFNLTCGMNSFLPSVRVTIDDSVMIFRESNFINRGDVITVWVGNAKDDDHEPIKNDYYVLEASSSTSSRYVTLTCVLHVPKLWNVQNRSLDMTSLDALKQIARDCDLGFASNISNSNDSMIWIQHQTNMNFIDKLVDHSYIDDTTYMQVYVDQFANLTVLDIKKSINTNTKTMLTTAPLSGEKLRPPVELIATNNSEGSEIPRATIVSWSPVTEYGSMSTKYVDRISSRTLDITEHVESEVISAEINKQLKKSSIATSLHQDNVYEFYNTIYSINLNNRQLLQNTLVQAKLDYYIPVIYIGMSLPVEIWNISKHEERWSQDPNVDNNDLDEVPATGDPNKSNTYYKNVDMSGSMLLMNMVISYIRSSAKDAERRLQQNLTLFKK